MKTWPIGVIHGMNKEEGRNLFAPVAEFGMKVCQLVNWDPALWTDAWAKRVVRESKAAKVRVCALWSGYSGPAVWNFIEGPTTLGLVPPKYRKMRVAQLNKAADFAAKIGAPAIITHCGFIPENPSDPLYKGTVDAIRDVARHARKRRVEFWFETGQETPVTLLRTFEDVGLDNLGINFDTANVILYGKANPLDALDVFGKFVKNLHVKDGVYPTTGRDLGHETPAGEGKVDFPKILRRLQDFRFRGELIIEREISGPQQAKDIRATVRKIERWLR
jgi:L-ribulose-5-phosphate 3-epimerase